MGINGQHSNIKLINHLFYNRISPTTLKNGWCPCTAKLPDIFPRCLQHLFTWTRADKWITCKILVYMLLKHITHNGMCHWICACGCHFGTFLSPLDHG